MLHPLELFGLSVPIEEKTLTKQYATIASMCHPARQGNEEQYWTVTMAYYYLKNNEQKDTFEAFLSEQGGYQEGCTKEFMTIQELEDIVFDREDFRKMWEETRSRESSMSIFETNYPVPMNAIESSSNGMMNGYDNFSNYMNLEYDDYAPIFPMLSEEMIEETIEETTEEKKEENTMVEIRVISNENESIKRRRLL
jgi:hypothetical protein